MDKKLERIVIFTDGSHVRATNKCGYGVLYPNGEFTNISRPIKLAPLTNQRAELYAIYKGLSRVFTNSPSSDVIVYTDSEYSIKSMTIWIKIWKKNNWKTANGKEVLNQDIIKKIDNILQNNIGKIEFKHVRAHTGKDDYESQNNAIVDILAKDGGSKS